MGIEITQVLDFKEECQPTSHVLEGENEVVNNLWETLRQAKSNTQYKPQWPFEELDFGYKTLELKFKRKYQDQGSKLSRKSKAKTLKTLPSYKGNYEVKYDI